MPTTEQIQTAIRRDLDGMVQEYKRELMTQAGEILRELDASNDIKRKSIDPLYEAAFNIAIPAGVPAGINPREEFKNLSDARIYPDAWKKLIINAPLDSSNYMRRFLEPIVSNPKTDKGAAERIQKDAVEEWDRYKSYAAERFSREILPVANNFETKLLDLAQQHKDLRDALGSIIGPIPQDDFDTDFAKYISQAEAKALPQPSASPQPAGSPVPVAAGSPPPAPVPTQATPMPEPAVNLAARLNDLASILKGQQESIDAVKIKAQTLDDNYPILHGELGGQMRNISSEVSSLRIMMAVIVCAMPVCLGLSILAFARAGGAASKRKDLNASTLEKLTKLQKELAQLRMQVLPEEKPMESGGFHDVKNYSPEEPSRVQNDIGKPP